MKDKLEGKSISLLFALAVQLLYNMITTNPAADTAHMWDLTLPDSQGVCAQLSWGSQTIIRVLAGISFSSGAQLGRDPLLPWLRGWQNSTPCGCRPDSLSLLLAIGQNSPSVPRGCPWFLATWSFPTWLKAKEGEKERLRQVGSYNTACNHMIMDTQSHVVHHFYPILSGRNKTQALPSSQRGELHKGITIRRWGSWWPP